MLSTELAIVNVNRETSIVITMMLSPYISFEDE